MVQSGFREESGTAADTAAVVESSDTEVAALLSNAQEHAGSPLRLLEQINVGRAEAVRIRVLNEHVERENITLRDMMDEIHSVRNEVWAYHEPDIRDDIAEAVDAELQPIIDNIRDRVLGEIQARVGGHSPDDTYDRIMNTSGDFVNWVRALIRRAITYNNLHETPAETIFELMTGVDTPNRDGIKVIITWGRQRVRGNVSRVQALTLTIPWIGRGLLMADQDGVERSDINARRLTYAKVVILAVLHASLG